MSQKSMRYPTTRYLSGPPGAARELGWHLWVSRTNATSAGVIPLTKNAYTAANQPQGDKIEAVSSDAGDTTQTITHVGIDSDGNRVEETVNLNGTTVVSTSDLFTYWEFSVLDAVCAGAVTVREASGDATITTITAGDLVSQVAHIFSGEHTLLITSFGANITSIAGNVVATLYRYPAASSCVTPTSGLIGVDTISIFDTEGIAPGPRNYHPLAIQIGPGEYVTIKTTGEGGDDEDIDVTLSGIVIP